MTALNVHNGETQVLIAENGALIEFTPSYDASKGKRARRHSISITTENATIQIEERTPRWLSNYASYARDRRRYDTDYNEAPRMYVWVKNEETLLENLQNRTRRPYTVYKKMASELFATLNINVTKTQMHWNQHAGCRMCPCSPGFVLPRDLKLEFTLPNGEVIRFDKFDFVVSLNNAPAVDENKAPRNIDGIL